MTVKSSQKFPCVHIWVNSQKGQLTDFDLYNFQLKSASIVGGLAYVHYNMNAFNLRRIMSNLDGPNGLVIIQHFKNTSQIFNENIYCGVSL